MPPSNQKEIKGCRNIRVVARREQKPKAIEWAAGMQMRRRLARRFYASTDLHDHWPAWASFPSEAKLLSLDDTRQNTRVRRWCSASRMAFWRLGNAKKSRTWLTHGQAVRHIITVTLSRSFSRSRPVRARASRFDISSAVPRATPAIDAMLSSKVLDHLLAYT
jgi:hypothetical protein